MSILTKPESNLGTLITRTVIRNIPNLYLLPRSITTPPASIAEPNKAQSIQPGNAAKRMPNPHIPKPAENAIRRLCLRERNLTVDPSRAVVCYRLAMTVYSAIGNCASAEGLNSGRYILTRENVTSCYENACAPINHCPGIACRNAPVN